MEFGAITRAIGGIEMFYVWHSSSKVLTKRKKIFYTFFFFFFFFFSKLFTSCLTAIESHDIRYCEMVYETSNENWFWSIKNFGEELSKMKCRGFRATSLSTNDFLLCIPHCHII